MEKFTKPKVAIIGAGSSGLAAAKNLKDLGIDFLVYEAQDEVGGNWYFGSKNSRVYQSTHLISSKTLTEYTDFPMPKDYPHYPNHAQVHAYFKSYAKNFDLYPKIAFNTRVEKIFKEGKTWKIKSHRGEESFTHLIVANGHNWDPKIPKYPGIFSGKIIHSAEYKDKSQLIGKKVLVVGAGNSGCDIAVEAAQNAKTSFHSTRRGYHYLPKFVFGKPADIIGELFLKLRTPIGLRRFFIQLLVKLQIGSPKDHKLPIPEHKLFETHPIVNSQLYYYLGHGDVKSKSDIDFLDDTHVAFKDGTREEIDLIIFATGYNITLPFIDRQYLNWKDSRPELFLNVFHPEDDTFFIAGLIQPDSGQWGLVDYQCKAIARYIFGLRSGDPQALKFQKLKKNVGSEEKKYTINYIKSSRHLIEVEHFSYRNRLIKWSNYLLKGTC